MGDAVLQQSHSESASAPALTQVQAVNVPEPRALPGARLNITAHEAHDLPSLPGQPGAPTIVVLQNAQPGSEIAGRRSVALEGSMLDAQRGKGIAVAGVRDAKVDA